jgi:large subunit ribosomal protein L17
MAGRLVRGEEALTRLFSEVAPRFRGRTGGYTRVLKTRIRRGDAVSMSLVELVEMGEKPAAKPAKSGKKAEDKGEKAAEK